MTENGMKTERFVLMISPDLLERIGDYRHTNRIGSQAEAARQLMEVGLEKEMAAAGSKFGDQNPAAAGNNDHQEKTDVSDNR